MTTFFRGETLRISFSHLRLVKPQARSLRQNTFCMAVQNCCTIYICIHFSVFNFLFSHLYLPYGFLLGTISPIVKDSSGDCSISSNYRPITLGPIFSQLFENALRKKFNSFLLSDDLQFAYKKSRSTAHDLFVLKSCVDYYTTFTVQQDCRSFHID